VVARWIATRPGLVLAAALAATAIALPSATRLTIRTELDAMLPAGTPAAEAYREFLHTFGGIERVYVMVRLPDGAPADPERLADAAEALADALSASPEVSRVRYGLDPSDEEFAARQLAPRLPLLLGDRAPVVLAPRLTDAAIAARVAELKDAASGPGAIFLSALAAADPLGLSGEASVTPTSALPFDPVTGVLLSTDQRAALLVVTPRRAESDATGGRALLRVLDEAYAETSRADGGDLRFEAVGGPLYAVHDQEALQDDLIRIVTVAGVVVILMIVIAFEGFSIPAVSIAAVAIGQVWCAAIVAAMLGNVTAVGVGFAAILLGLGDDFTIHLGSRFREVWASGTDAAVAMRRAVEESWPGIATAALTTSVAFACLGLAHFRPLRELGIVVALGVLLLLAATLTAAAPLLLFATRFWKRTNRAPRWGGFAWIVTSGVRAGTAAPRTALVACGLVSLAALAGASRLTIDTDMRLLRPTDHPTTRAEQALFHDFGVGADTAIVSVHGADVPEALDRADAVAREARGAFPGAEVSTPSDWIVDGARLKDRMTALAPLHLDRAAARLGAALDRAGLNAQAFAPALDTMRAIGEGKVPPPIVASTWPDWIADGIKTDGAGASVAVRMRLPEGTWTGGPPASFLASIQAQAPGARLAHAKRLGAELRSVAVSDLMRLGALAFVLVLGIVAISYRGDLAATALTFVPVAVGTACTAGLWGWLGRPLDLFSLSVLPVMVGIGVDDGLHVLHLARRRGEDFERAALQAGRGIVLTNLTTCAGFASLMLSHVPGLRNGGLLICVGNLFCLGATLVVLPAVARLGGRRGAPAS